MVPEAGAGTDTVTNVDAGGASPQTQDTPSAGAAPTQAGNQVQELRTALEEQRSVQSGLDRQISTLKQQTQSLSEERDQLKADVERLQDTLTSTDDVKSKYEEQYQELQSKLSEREAELSGELGNVTSQVDRLQAENQRLKVLVGEFPNLSALVEADALPQAETLDEFREKLDKLSGTFVSKQAAEDYARGKGSRPPASPPAETPSNLDDLQAKMDAAREANDWDKYRALSDQWMAAVDEADLPAH